MADNLQLDVEKALKNPEIFIRNGSKLTLRDYQRGPVHTILDSISKQDGRSIVVMFPRQSGKNEIQAQLEAYLLALFGLTNCGDMVKVSPTWKPQTLNAMSRLERVLQTNALTRPAWSKESGYIYKLFQARISFFSGQPRSNIVGATASLLLEVDEAQDVLTSKYDKEIAPMAAARNATRVFWGTAWTSRTLLSRELRLAQALEKKDGIRRTFVLTADEVAMEVEAYGEFVEEQVQRLGRNHPMVKTQYFSEEIDAEGGLFPPERQALMRGTHEPQPAPQPEHTYCMTLDVAGADETITPDLEDGEDVEILAASKRDSTALTIFEVDMASVDDPLIRKPTYKVVSRHEWVDVPHSTLYGNIKALAELYDIRYLVVDCTGVGAGLTSFLTAAFGDRVIPFTFTSRSKSDLLWSWLGLIDSGRFKDHAPAGVPVARPDHCHSERSEESLSASLEQQEFWRQVSFCEFEVLIGPQKTVRWGVPDGTRDPSDGNLVHDDLVISAALVAALDEQDWTPAGPTLIIPSKDPLKDMDKGF
jgi:hypothetical protein